MPNPFVLKPLINLLRRNNLQIRKSRMRDVGKTVHETVNVPANAQGRDQDHQPDGEADESKDVIGRQKNLNNPLFHQLDGIAGSAGSADFGFWGGFFHFGSSYRYR